MVEVNKAYIIPCNNGIYIDCSVLDMEYFNNVYIDKIIIDSQDTFTESGPSSNPIYSYTVPYNQKSVKLTIKSTDLLVNNISDNMYFIYIITKGTPSPNTPCGLDNNTTTTVVFDNTTIYNTFMNHIGKLQNNCIINKELIDLILRYRALESCIGMKDYSRAIVYWNKFIQHITKNNNNCTCNG